MREQHGPGIADPVVEVNMPLRRIGFKVRGDVIDLQCHDPPLSSQRAKVPSAKPDIGHLTRPHYPKIAKKYPVDAIMYGLDPAGDSRCNPARPLPSIGHSWSGTGSLIAATPRRPVRSTRLWRSGSIWQYATPHSSTPVSAAFISPASTLAALNTVRQWPLGPAE